MTPSVTPSVFNNVPAGQHPRWVVAAYNEFEYTATGAWGTRLAPTAILQAGAHIEPLLPRYGELIGPSRLAVKTLVDNPLFDEPLRKASAHRERLLRVFNTTSSILASAEPMPKVLALGGEHSLTFATVSAYLDRRPKDENYRSLGNAPFVVVYLDAHTDLYPKYQDNPLSHASVAHRLLTELGVPVLQIGTRSFNPGWHALMYGDRYACAMWDERQTSIEHIFQTVFSLRHPVDFYISLDLDVLDPSVLRNVSCPEPGGMSYWDVLEVFRQCAYYGNIVGGDVVEMTVPPQQCGTLSADAMTAAQLAFHMMLAAELGEEYR